MANEVASTDGRSSPEAIRLGKEFVAHVERMWCAEKEIAERYAARARTLVTLSSSMLGGTLVVLGATLLKLTEFGVLVGIGGRVIIGLLVFGVVSASGYYLLKVPILVLRSVRYPVEAQARLWDDRVKDAANRADGGPRVFPTASHRLSLPEEFLDWITMEGDPVLVVIGTQHLQAAEDLRSRNRREKHRLQAGEIAMTRGLRTSLLAVAIFMGLIAVSFVETGGVG